MLLNMSPNLHGGILIKFVIKTLILILFPGVLIFLPCGNAHSKTSLFSPLSSHKQIQDNGNLSLSDNIFGFNSKSFAGDQDREQYELYLYSLSLRIGAIRNILEVARVTRSYGQNLGIDPKVLSEIPTSLIKNFPKDRFPDLYVKINKLRAGSFGGVDTDMAKLIDTYGKRGLKILKLTKELAYRDTVERAYIEKNYKAKLPVVVPFGTQSMTVINRTVELAGYNDRIDGLNREISEYEDRIKPLISDLYLYLPFYDSNIFKVAYEAVFSERKADYIFADLLLAYLIYDNTPEGMFKDRKDLAKWIHKGIDSPEQYAIFQQIFNRYLEGPAIDPSRINSAAKESFKIAVEESIRNQNAALDFLASSQFVNRPGDIVNCHYNAAQKYEGLARQISFLSRFLGLRSGFIRDYGSAMAISDDRSQILAHKLELIYDDELKSKERGWIMPLRVAALTAAILTPSGWIAIAIIAGFEVVNAATAWQVSKATMDESLALRSLYDAESITASANGYSTIDDYRESVELAEKYSDETASAIATIPVDLVAYLAITNIAKLILIKNSLVEIPKILVPINAAPKLARALIVGSSAAIIIFTQISEGVGMEKQAPLYGTEELEKTGGSSEMNAASLLDFMKMDVPPGADSDLKLVSLARSGNLVVMPYRIDETRIFETAQGKTVVAISKDYLGSDHATVENLLFETAYYFYLYKTSNLLKSKALRDDPGFAAALKTLIGNPDEIPDLLSGAPENEDHYRKALANTIRMSLFNKAKNYALSLGGIPDSGREYFGFEYTDWK
jgi:hypothetical protein